MATFVIEQLEEFIPFPLGTEEIRLRIGRLGRVAKVDAAMCMTRGDVAGAESILLRTVSGWTGVVDGKGVPLKFDSTTLDRFLGMNDELATKLIKFLFERNGLAEGTSEAPLDRERDT